MSETPKKDGGTGWELSEAIRLMGDAVASGDPTQIATAMRRHGEALSNSAAKVLIPTLTTTLETVLKTQIGLLARRLDNSDRARLKRNGDFQDHIDSRFDGLTGELDKLLASQEGLARGLGKHTGDIEELRAITSAHADSIAAIQQADRDDIRAKIAQIEERQERLDRDHKELRERLGRSGVDDDGE